MASDAVTSPACSAQSRDADDPLDPLAPEGGARRPTEVDVGGLDALGVGVWRHQPEHRVSACERPGDDVAVAVRSLHDLNALAGVCGKEGGIACDHADRLVALEQVVQHLMADQASGSSDDDHDNHLQVGLTDVACFCSMYDFLSTSFLV